MRCRNNRIERDSGKAAAGDGLTEAVHPRRYVSKSSGDT